MPRTDPAETAAAFHAQRGRLVSLALRMLGSEADAEDAVQEAWIRLARQDAGTIDNLDGWLTTVVSRVCLDMLRSRRNKPETSYEEWPRLIVTEDDDTNPENDAVQADAVGLAMLVVLNTLKPAERLALVLHDMFAIPFAEIARILEKSEDASKMLASRARRKVQTGQRPPTEREQQRVVIDAFLKAAREGDFKGLLEVLHPDITWRTHHPHGVEVKRGITDVEAAVSRGLRARGKARRVLVDGEPGVISWSRTGKPLGVMSCRVTNGRIVEVESIVDPRRLAKMDLPSPPD